jgi:ferredoxin-type protein NapH
MAWPISRMECPVPHPAERPPATLGRKLSRWRPWVQTGFLGIWLAPVGRWLHGIPGCVFHCYSCPLSAFACPVGVMANYAALLPVVWEVPYLLIGLLLLLGASSGSLICGWACPFGFLQDLLAKISKRKIVMPSWIGYFRYLVLVGLVILLPMILGYQGIPFEKQVISICRICPAGALEAGLPYSLQSLLAGNGWIMSGMKTGILISFFAAAIFVHRPWCRIFCPLGGLLALFNRFSLFHLRYNPKECTECNLCRSRCSMGVRVDQQVNVSGCIRCLECTTCGALEPSFAVPTKNADHST